MNLLSLLLLVSCICIAVADPVGHSKRKKATKFTEYHCFEPSDDAEEDYKAFLKCHHADYKPDSHHSKRKANFLKCREAMLKHDPDEVGWSVGTTHLCHWTDDEFKQMLMNVSETNELVMGAKDALFDEELHKLPMPRSDIDWAARGYVTSVKQQGTCGSCYAFAVAATIESYVAIRKNIWLDLSPQQILDCSGNYGCNGGYIPTCFNYIRNTAALLAWSCYSYVGYQQYCYQNNWCGTHQGISAYYQVAAGDEVAMANAVLWFGPVAVTFDVSGFGVSYTGGVWDGYCTMNTNHIVSVVGYGTDAYGKPYWIFKNSWGTGWGEWGYGKIVRGKNKCAIASYAYYAVIP